MVGSTAVTAAATTASGADARARAARVWYGAIAVVVGVALVIQIVLIFTGGQDVNSSENTADESLATRFVRLFSFFTIQSNLFVLGTSVVLALNVHKDGRLWRVLRFDALIGIIITGLVYETVLARLVHPEGWALAATIGFHYISPWATVLGWLVFGPRPRMSWATAALAFVWPLAWLVYTFVHGAVTGWYPYPFLDVDTIGFADSVRNSAVVLAIAVVVAVVLRLLDGRLPSLVRDVPGRMPGSTSRDALGGTPDPGRRDTA